MQASRYHIDFLPCNLYIDAANIKIHLSEVGLSEDFDPRKIAGFVEKETIGGMRLSAVRTFVYDAVDEHAPERFQERMVQYNSRIETLPNTHVVLGTVHGARGNRSQKGVDVQLAVDALNAAWSGIVAAVAIASGDADFVPVVEAIRGVGPHVLVISFQSALSRELSNAADRVIILPERPRDWTIGPHD